MACAHKGLQLDTVPWRFTEKDRLPRPNSGTAPVLVDGDRVIADSWRIACYLDERYPGKQLFGCDMARAHALVIKYWVERTLQPLASRMILCDVWCTLHEKDKAYFRETREKRFGKPLEVMSADRGALVIQFRTALDPLRAALSEQPYISGGTPSFADYCVLGMFKWAQLVSQFELLESSDPLVEWRQKCLEQLTN
jgi:glutathione S-transferase